MCRGAASITPIGLHTALVRCYIEAIVGVAVQTSDLVGCRSCGANVVAVAVVDLIALFVPAWVVPREVNL